MGKLINVPTQSEVDGLTKYLEPSNGPNLLTWFQKKDTTTTKTTEVVANLNIFQDIDVAQKTKSSSKSVLKKTNKKKSETENTITNITDTTEGKHEVNEKYDSSGTLSSIPTKFENPKTDILSYQKDGKKLVWVEIEGIPIHKLTGNVRAQKAYKDTANPDANFEDALAISLKGAKHYTFTFLAQQELIETISHDWQPYDSVGSTIAGAYAQFGISTLEQIKALGPEFRKGSVEEIVKALKAKFTTVTNQIQSSDKKTETILNALSNTFSAAAKGGYVANYRVDTPLQYKGSERRSFELVFTLINTQPGKNHEEVVLPVKLLEMLSSPSYGLQPDKGFNVDIILPYVFSVNTKPGNLLTCDMAVLKQVQPTWRGPWIDGYPSRCELRLSFTEYRPLEQKVFYGTSEQIIQTTQKERATAYEKLTNTSDVSKKEVSSDTLSTTSSVPSFLKPSDEFTINSDMKAYMNGLGSLK